MAKLNLSEFLQLVGIILLFVVIGFYEPYGIIESNLPGQRREYQAPTMASLQEKDQTFIVRLWLEPRDGGDSGPQWRGVIENVQNGKRRYLKDINEIAAFIVPYLEKMGVTIPSPPKSRKWFFKWW